MPAFARDEIEIFIEGKPAIHPHKAEFQGVVNTGLNHLAHSDNGTEYINGPVAEVLEKLRIEQTKSRSRQSNDTQSACREPRGR